MSNVATSIIDNTSTVQKLSLWVNCDAGHSWEIASGVVVNLNSYSCPSCAVQTLTSENSLVVNYPDLFARIMDIDTDLELLTMGSNKRVALKLDNGSTWVSTVANMVKHYDANGGNLPDPYSHRDTFRKPIDNDRW